MEEKNSAGIFAERYGHPRSLNRNHCNSVQSVAVIHPKYVDGLMRVPLTV